MLGILEAALRRSFFVDAESELLKSACTERHDVGPISWSHRSKWHLDEGPVLEGIHAGKCERADEPAEIGLKGGSAIRAAFSD